MQAPSLGDVEFLLYPPSSHAYTRTCSPDCYLFTRCTSQQYSNAETVRILFVQTLLT